MHVTVRVEWDMGHRLARHAGKCSDLHGHRYAVEVTVKGDVDDSWTSTHGMVADFGDIKQTVRREVERLDHKFLLEAIDPLADRLNGMPGVVFVDYTPTGENIARDLLGRLRVSMHAAAVESVRLFETPTSWVDAW